MPRGFRRIAIALAVLAVLLLAYVAAGPYLAIRGIRAALAEQDMAGARAPRPTPAACWATSGGSWRRRWAGWRWMRW